MLRAAIVLIIAGSTTQAQQLDSVVGQSREPGESLAGKAVTMEDPGFVLGALLARDMLMKLEKQGYELDRESLMRGFAAQLNGDLKNRQQELQKAYQMIQEKNQQQRELARQQEKIENLKFTQNFLQQNSRKEGVKTLETGIQVEVIREGFGEQPGDGDTAVCYIKATTFSGTELNDDFRSGSPTRLVINQAVPALAECLPEMKRTARWKIIAPPEKAYGEAGLPPRIPGNMGIIYEVELLQFSSQINNVEFKEPVNVPGGTGTSDQLIEGLPNAGNK